MNAPCRWLLSAIVMTSGLVGRPVAGDDDTGVSRDVRSMFFIAKSQNKNQVHYGIHLDRACEPVGPQPIHGYWRMLENRGEVEPLLGMEAPAYGLHEQQQVQKGPDSTTIRIKLRAFPDRPLAVSVTQAGEKCDAIATTTIAGTAARLHSIYVKLKWPFGIDSVLLRGWSRADGRLVEEWIQN